MNWPKLFCDNLEIIEKSFQPTADSLESCRVTVYVHSSTQKMISNILELNQNLSIKKILDHSALVIHENIINYSKKNDVLHELKNDNRYQHMHDLREHSLNICLFTSIYNTIIDFEVDSKSRKTFVMSKRSEGLYKTISSTLKISLDIVINCVFIGYYKHLSGTRLDIYKTYAAFMEEYQDVFYKIENICCSPFIRHVGSFSCPEVGDILDDIFDKYQNIEHIVRSAMMTSYISNHISIENLDDLAESVPTYDGYKDVYIKSIYNKFYFDHDPLDNLEKKDEV